MELKLIEKKLSLSKDVVCLSFVSNKKIDFKAGQFLMFDTIGLKRAYSIASSPLDDKLSFYIKKASENGMSKYLVEDIQKNDILNASGPFGNMFVDKTEKKENFLLISIGSGLGPMLSIYKYLVQTKNFGKIVNVFGERYRKNIVDDTLNLMKSFEAENVKNYFFLSKEKVDGFETGYVHNALEKSINFLGKNTKVYICGKPAMVDEAFDKLQKLGLKKENIMFEKY